MASPHEAGSRGSTSDSLLDEILRAMPPPTILDCIRAWEAASKEDPAGPLLDRILKTIAREGLDHVLSLLGGLGSELPSALRTRGRAFLEILSDPNERAHLSVLCANPEEGLAWLAYADWLDGCGDARGVFLRALVTRGNVSQADDPLDGLIRSQDVLAEIDPLWRMAILELRKSRILNCGAAPTTDPPGVRFAFRCPNRWESLEPAGGWERRFCKDCQKHVFFCRTEEEAREHAVAGNCIAITSRMAVRAEEVYKRAQESLRLDGVLITLGVPSLPSDPLSADEDPRPYQIWGEVLLTKRE